MSKKLNAKAVREESHKAEIRECYLTRKEL